MTDQTVNYVPRCQNIVFYRCYYHSTAFISTSKEDKRYERDNTKEDAKQVTSQERISCFYGLDACTRSRAPFDAPHSHSERYNKNYI